MSFRIWPSQTIRRATKNGTIASAAPLLDDQIQPASLDLRLGKIAYRVPASFLPGAGHKVVERLEQLSTHRINIAQPTVLERDCVHIVPLMERVKLGGKISARANPKSSSGRLDIFVRLIVDGGASFDEVPEGYDGPLYAEVVPRSFPVIVSEGSRLNQIRFREGKAAGGRNRSMNVSVNLEPMGEDGVVAFRARKNSGLIDLARVGAYRREEFWEPIRLNAGQRGLVLAPDEFYILASLENIGVEADEAAEMIAYDTSVGEVRVHYAGFLDPGFGLAAAGGAGSKIVLEVRCHDVPFLLDHGQKVGTLLFEKTTEPADIVYGENIASHYQGQGLKLSKHFL